MAQAKGNKIVVVEEYGNVQIKTVDIPQVGDNELLVKIEAAPINPSDALHTRGHYPTKFETPCRAGFEGAGTVVEVGKAYNGRFKAGDKVCIMSQERNRGTWSQYSTYTEEHVYPMNPELTFEEAASHWINPVTAALMLREVQKEGHKAVIHSAGASAIGKMMIRLFKEQGIKTINFVRRDEVKDELYKLGADHVINLKDADFEKQLDEAIKKEQPTKFYDAVVGDLHTQVLRKMPPGSISNVYGLLSGKIELGLTALDLFGGKTVSSFYVFVPWSKLSQKEKNELIDFIQARLKSVFSSEIIKTFSLDQIKEAIEYSEANASKGKIIIKPQ